MLKKNFPIIIFITLYVICYFFPYIFSNFFFHPDLLSDRNLSIVLDFYNKAFITSILGIIFFILGYFSYLKYFSNNKGYSKFIIYKKVDTLFLYFLISLIFFIFFSFIDFFSEFKIVFYDLIFIFSIIIFYSFHKNILIKLLFFFIVLLFLLLDIATSNTAPFIKHSIQILLVMYFMDKLNWKIIYIFLILTLFFLLAKADLRVLSSYDVSFFERIFSVYTYIDQETFKYVAMRINQLFILALSIDFHYFGDTEVYFNHFFGSLIPRIFWFNKPLNNIGQNFGHDLYLIGSYDYVTSVNVPLISQIIIAFGLGGVIFIFFIIGMIFSYIFSKKNNIENLISKTIFFSYFVFIIENSSYSLFGSILKYIFCFLFFYFIHSLLIKKIK